MTMMINLPPELEGEYTIRLVNMPTASPGFIICDEDNHYNVYLNSKFTRESNAETAVHELAHAINDDFNNSDPIQTIESRASACRGGVAPPALPPLIRASDLLPKSLPPLGKVAFAEQMTDEVPRSPVSPVHPHHPVPLTPHQTDVLRRCIADLDAFLLFDDPYLY